MEQLTTTQDLTNIPAGTYSVTYRCQRLYPTLNNILITQPIAITLTETHMSMQAVNGASTGSI
jgi:hypothetical protein